MKGGNKHIVQKTMLDLEYHGEADALALQKMIAGWSGTALLAALEEALGRAIPQDRVMKIDTLELEINVQGTGNWLEQVQQQLSFQLGRRLAEVSYESRVADEEYGLLSPEQNFVTAFVFFLEQGTWPWWSSIRGQQEFIEGLEAVLRPEMQESMKRSIREKLRYPQPRQRVLWQLPEPLFYRLLMVLAPEISSWLLPAREEIESIGTRLPAPAEKTWLAIWKKFLMEELPETKSCTVQEIMRRYVLSVTEKKCGELLDMIRSIPLAPVLQEAIEQAITPGRTKEAGPGNREKKVQVTADQKQEPEDRTMEMNARELAAEPVADEDGIYINNAGLVILAGFLPMLFKKLGLTDEQSVLRDKNKAAMLVQYLASGGNGVAEFELGLAKVLCGIEMPEPVDTTLLLTEAEKAEANELLLSAIEYWNVLKDTSVEGLRESFLLREGKLAFRDNQWFLQVEQRPYDMLLQNLPWNITMIRLPWMSYMLRTEWTF